MRNHTNAMAIEVRWLDDTKTIVHSIYQSNWTIQDLDSAVEQINCLIRSQSHPVYVISEMPHGKLTPPRDLLLSLRDYERAIPPNFALSVVVGGGAFAQAFDSILLRIVPRIGQTTRFTDSIPAACAIINAHQQVNSQKSEVQKSDKMRC